MLSKTLIVCVLALFCLQLALAGRLDTRIAGDFTASPGQFPYVVYLSYNYPVGNTTVQAQGTGIIYSNSALVSSANFFANFPTSSPQYGEILYVAAFGNQNSGGPTFPKLKFAALNTKRNNLCALNLTANGVTQPLNFSLNFCLQSGVNSTNLQGVCGKDIGGPIIRTTDITNAATYYEVVGLVSYAADNKTCNPANPVPVIASYLSVYQATFFTPILGSLAAAGNKQNATLNPRPGTNAICGNGIVDGTEACDYANNAICCSTICTERATNVRCGSANTTNVCVTNARCQSGTCVSHNRDGRKCSSSTVPRGFCKNGVCKH